MRYFKTSFLLMLLTISLILTLTVCLQCASADPGTLTVQVKTKDDRVLPGAEVLINNTISKTTDSNGVVTFSNVNLYAKQESIKVYYKNVLVYERLNFDTSGSSSVTLIVNVTNWRFTIYDSSGKNPVKDAMVKLKLDTLEDRRLTDSNGVVVFSNMPWSPGYEVVVLYVGVRVYDAIHTLDGSSKDINLNVKLYILNVSVSDLNGRPVKGASVKIWNGSTSYPVYAQGLTDTNGKVTLRFLVDSSYITVIEYRGDVLSNRTISVSSDKSYAVSVNLLYVNITVYNFKGNRIVKGENYILKGVFYKDGTQYSEEVSTTDGILRLGHAYFPRNYTLVVKIHGIEVYRGKYELKVETASGRVNAMFYDVGIIVSKGNVLSEKLIDRLNITLSIDNVFRLHFMMDKGLAKAFDLPPAKYQYLIKYGEYRVGSGSITITRDEDIVELHPELYRLSAKILNKENEPMQAHLTISTYDGKALKDFLTDENGNIDMDGLLPIKYFIEVRYLNKYVGSSEVTVTQDTTITINAEVYNLRAKILDYDNTNPLENALVNVRIEDFLLQNTTDRMGFVILKNVPAGRYPVYVKFYDVVVYEDFLTITSGDVITIGRTNVFDILVRVYDIEKIALEEGNVSVYFVGFEKTVKVGRDGVARIEDIPKCRSIVRYSLYGISAGEMDIYPEYDEQAFDLIAKVYPVTLTYKMADENPMVEGFVSIEYAKREILRKNLDALGRISIKIPAGSYSFIAYYKGIEVSRYDLSVHEKVSKVLEASVYLTELVVKEISGTPINGADIILNVDGKTFLRAKTDVDGRSSFYLPKEDYNLMILLEDVVILNSTYKARENNSIKFVYIPDMGVRYNIILINFFALAGLIGFLVYNEYFKKKRLNIEDRGISRRVRREGATIPRI